MIFFKGADQYTFHIEATQNPGELCRKIREAGMKVRLDVLLDILNYYFCKGFLISSVYIIQLKGL